MHEDEKCRQDADQNHRILSVPVIGNAEKRISTKQTDVLDHALIRSLRNLTQTTPKTEISSLIRHRRSTPHEQRLTLQAWSRTLGFFSKRRGFLPAYWGRRR